MQTAHSTLNLYLRKRRQRRIALILAGICALAAITVLLFFALQNKASFFRIPSEITAEDRASGRELRLGGYVEKGSVRRGAGAAVRFTITDFHHSQQVEFNGVLPDLFREGQGVIAEGRFNRAGLFIAARVLAKHDEKYVPKNVADRIKKAEGRSDMTNAEAAAQAAKAAAAAAVEKSGAGR